MKELGKIRAAYYGTISDYPFLMGLNVTIEHDGCIAGNQVGLVNTNRLDDGYAKKSIMEIKQLLEDANVSSVDDLVGKPVEATYENNSLKSFRILKEVL